MSYTREQAKEKINKLIEKYERIKADRRIRSGLRNLTRRLKKKRTIVSLAILVVVGIWAWFLLSTSPVQLQAYQQFLRGALLIFFFTFIFGFIITVPRKKKPRVRVHGEIEIKEGAEIHITTPQSRHWRFSRKVVKLVLILGSILSLFGFAYGIASFLFGYTSVALGGFIFGVGLALLFFRSPRYS